MDGRDDCMMLGPIECKTYSCIECEKRDDIWCNELNCCLDIWLHPKANCPYLILMWQETLSSALHSKTGQGGMPLHLID